MATGFVSLALILGNTISNCDVSRCVGYCFPGALATCHVLAAILLD